MTPAVVQPPTQCRGRMMHRTRLCARIILLMLFIACWTDASVTEASRQKAGRVRSASKQSRRPRSPVRFPASDLKKRVVGCKSPVFPHAHVQGTVAVEVLVGPDGAVWSAKAVSGHPLLRLSAERAAAQWTFRPYIVKGRAVPFKGNLFLVFHWDKEVMDKQCEEPRRPA